MGIGIQLWTLKDETATDFRGTLRKVADMGYEGVEFAGYGGIPADEMKELLQQLGLKAIGSHVGPQRLRDDLQGEIDYLLAIGCNYLIVPHVSENERQTEGDWKKLFAEFAGYAQAAKAAGLKFAYHNHDFEFTSKVDGKFAFDALFEAIPLAQVEIDTGWVDYAGLDPVAYIRTYSGRVPLLHLKDYVNHPETGRMKSVELGKGVLKIGDIIREGSTCGSEWLIVEQEAFEQPPIDSAKESIQWLRAHLNQTV